jgi:antitoxin ParD1/3/4
MKALVPCRYGYGSLNISLPQSLKDYIEEQVQARGYSTPSEYVRELLRHDQTRRAQQKLEAVLVEGLNSGTPLEISSEYWETKCRQLIERHTPEKEKT